MLHIESILLVNVLWGKTTGWSRELAGRDAAVKFECPHVSEFEVISPKKKSGRFQQLSCFLCFHFCHCFTGYCFVALFFFPVFLKRWWTSTFPPLKDFPKRPGTLDFFKRSDEAIWKVGLRLKVGRNRSETKGKPWENTWKPPCHCCFLHLEILETQICIRVDTFWGSFLCNHCKTRLLY